MKKLHSYSLLYLLLAVGLLGWSGCDDDEAPPPPPPVCNFDVPMIGYGEYCEPRFLDFNDLASQQSTGITNLPNGCAPNYNFSRVFTLEAPESQELFIHRYRNFPATVYVEVFGSNCVEDDFVLLACFNDDALVNIYELNTSSFDQIVVRAVIVPTGNYNPGDRPEDELNFAVFNSAPQVQLANGNTEAAFLRDCQGRPNRIILSPSPGSSDVIRAAEILGLPYRSCNCDDELVAVEFPNGISLDKVRPKVTQAEVEQDTTSTSFDRFIEIPVINPTSFNIDPNDDPFIGNNECLNYSEPSINSTNGNVKVAIIDSGVDYNTHSVFSDFAESGTSDCIPNGPFGYDFVNQTNEPLDEIGHGTSVASAFLSNMNISGNLVLNHYKFFGTDGGTLFDALCATATAVKNGSNLLNLSWGFESDGMPAALQHVLDQTVQGRVTVVTSAGNNGQNVLNMPSTNQYFPAASPDFGDYPNMVIVGSYRYNPGGTIERIDFSNYSSNVVDLAAIYGIECLQRNNAVPSYSAGTSISAPIVARILAEIMLRRTVNDDPEGTIDRFKADSTDTDVIQLPSIMDGRYLPLPDPEQGCAINFEG